MQYAGRLMRQYFGGKDGEEYVLYELPIVRGWAYVADALDNDPWLKFNQVGRSGVGYVGQERDKILADRNARRREQSNDRP